MDLVGCPMLVPWNSASFPFLYPIPAIVLVTTSAIRSSGDNVLQNKTIISSYRIQSKRKLYNYKVFVYLSDSYCTTTKSLYIYQILTVQLQSLCISIKFLLPIFISCKIMIHILTWFDLGFFLVYGVCCF